MIIKKTLLASSLLLSLSLANAQEIETADIPSGDIGRGFISGATMEDDKIPITNYSKNIKFGARVTASMYRSCGELNPFKNFKGRIEEQVEEKIDAVKEIAAALPQLILDSAVEYAIAKYNPTLFQLFSKKIDEYIEIFELHVKTCEDVRADMAQNPSADIFSRLIRISTADQWEKAIADGEFNNSRRFKEKLAKEAMKKGVKMADGKYYGGEDTPPINFVEHFAKAGLNIIAGRNETGSWDSAFPASEAEDKPITGVFNKAEDLVEFLEDIYGSKDIRINEPPEGVSPSDTEKTVAASRAGLGYYRYYYEAREKNVEHLQNYVDRVMSRQDFEKETGLLIPPAEIEDLRLLDPYARRVEIEALAKDKTLDQVEQKLLFAKAAISAGVNAPEMLKSKVYGVAQDEYKDLYYRILDDLAEISYRRY